MKVSIIVAIRNEEKYIENCIESLLNQSFKGSYEILVIDGMSDDRTLEIVNYYKKRYPKKIKVFENKDKFVAQGRNIGLKYSKAKYVAYLDGHSYADKDWLKNLYEFLESKDDKVAGVGSVHFNADKNKLGKAMTVAFSSLIGGGGSSYKPCKVIKKAYTAPFCLYRKKVLDKIGYYNVKFVKGQDAELNYRIWNKGYVLYKNPNARTYYYKRESLKKFFRQMFRYGFWRFKLMKKYPKMSGLSNFMPATFVILLVLGIIFSFFSNIVNILTLIYVILYLGGIFLFSIIESVKHKKGYYLFILPILFIFIHFGFGIGMINSFFKKTDQFIKK